ncbi:DUF3224 domain-containing protein [Micromonospora sp. ATA51]|uniref:DUF3224 domain-containing protein n=1 Tax=Micromonospora sp. ATA51 TaxID=2806098 RepID=UPI001A3C8EE2|nr:DUF3224 domain-containing protein [Micromonospora sp. ATA51]MBM0225305.1 DUF3224 domain-containing protein [Micromonospora sp. ATA51]
MTGRAEGSFTLDSWDQEAYDEADGAVLAEARITKTFTGDLTGASTTRILMCRAQVETSAVRYQARGGWGPGYGGCGPPPGWGGPPYGWPGCGGDQPCCGCGCCQPGPGSAGGPPCCDWPGYGWPGYGWPGYGCCQPCTGWGGTGGRRRRRCRITTSTIAPTISASIRDWHISRPINRPHS